MDGFNPRHRPDLGGHNFPPFSMFSPMAIPSNSLDLLLKHMILTIEEKILNLLTFLSNGTKKKEHKNNNFTNTLLKMTHEQFMWVIKILGFYSSDKSHCLENGESLMGW